MAILKAFRGLRPPVSIAKLLASRPYDVLNSAEARIEAEGNDYSLLHIIKPEIDLSPEIDEHDEAVYLKAKENFEKFKANKWLVPDEKPKLYIYAQTMEGRTQYGIVGCAGVEDYMNGIIKKHELTRKDKEEDRMKHVRITNANMEPVFFTYPAVKEIDEIVDNIVKNEKPEYDFVADDGFGHHFWVINNDETINKIIKLFETKVPYTYVADGHHRTAAAALVGNEKKNNNPNHKGDEEYNFFLAVAFPASHLKILDYNRVVKDLNGLSKNDFLEKIRENFLITEVANQFKPEKKGQFGMYLDGKWYKLEAKTEITSVKDPVEKLDVSILQKYVLSAILGINDPRTDKRIDFVGGIRGLSELEKRVNSGEMAVAFALYPTSIKELMDIADAGQIMPPKSTWFEPKLRDGLFVHFM